MNLYQLSILDGNVLLLLANITASVTATCSSSPCTGVQIITEAAYTPAHLFGETWIVEVPTTGVSVSGSQLLSYTNYQVFVNPSAVSTTLTWIQAVTTGLMAYRTADLYSSEYGGFSFEWTTPILTVEGGAVSSTFYLLNLTYTPYPTVPYVTIYYFPDLQVAH